MHTAHSIHHLRYSQMDDEASEGKRLFRRQFVLFSHESHHFHGCDRCRFVQVWVEAEREPSFHGTSPRQCQCQIRAEKEFHFHFHGAIERRAGDLPVALNGMTVAGKKQAAGHGDGQE